MKDCLIEWIKSVRSCSSVAVVRREEAVFFKVSLSECVRRWDLEEDWEDFGGFAGFLRH